MKWIAENSSKEQAEKFRKFLRTWQPAINSTTADSMTNAVITVKTDALVNA